MEVNDTGKVAEIAKREGGMSEGQRKGGLRGTEGGTALGEWKEQTFAFCQSLDRGGAEVSAGGGIMRSCRGAERNNKLI